MTELNSGTMPDLDVQGLHQRLHDDIEQLLVRDSDPAEYAWLNDGSQSLIANMYNRRRHLMTFKWTSDREGFDRVPLFDEAADVGVRSPQELYDTTTISYGDIPELSKKPGQDIAITHQRVATYIQQQVLATKANATSLEQSHAIETLTLIASMYKPDELLESGLARKSVLSPSSRKGLSPGSKTFLTAVNILDQYTKRKYTADQQYGLEQIGDHTELPLTVLGMQGSAAEKASIEAYSASKALKFYASANLELVTGRTVTAGRTEAELYTWDRRDQLEEYQAYKAAANDKDADIHIPIVGIDWNMLAIPDETKRDTLSNSEALGDSNEYAGVDPERDYDKESLMWLGNLAVEWGNGAYLVETHMGSKGQRYRAAILPAKTKDGTKIEHAIAKHAADGRHAVFAFRGEQGVDDAGNIWLTWQDAFHKDHTRKDAKRLGARRMIHNANLDDNVRDVLLRDAEDIDNPRYGR